MFLDRDHACQTKGCIRHFAPTKIIGNIPLYFKFYRLKHLDKFIAWGRRWRQNNKAAVNNHTRSRRAKLRGAAIVEKIDENVVYERDKGICQLCFKKVKRADKSLDHVIPISLGGNHSYQNIVLVHRSCNSIKGNRFVPQQQRLFG
jgi:5-methylcytosine-specific restriction endonuclease McrA